MKTLFTFIAPFLCLIASGCVTPVAVKDASTMHRNNLAGLQQAVGNYQGQITAYYNRLIQQQRQGHIALHVNKSVEAVAKTQSESISNKMRRLPNSQEPAQDFILVGANLADQFVSWGDNFDRWVFKTEGGTLKERRKSLLELADEVEKSGNREVAKKIRTAARMSDDDLTYVHVAIELIKQHKILETQIALLSAQVTTMQAFHAKIDEFLSIDATIDGDKIAEAAAAGSRADITGILPQQ